jgi:hypothetical protein
MTGTINSGRSFTLYSQPSGPRASTTARSQSGISGMSGRVATTRMPAVIHQPRVRMPISANGRIDGFNRISAPGHFQRSAAATRAAKTITGAPRK